MAKRKFELPGIQDLSKEQEATRALPKEGQHLIVGGPGTGKSVLALIRARRHHREKDDYLFLVFIHLLNRASGQLFGDGPQQPNMDGMVPGHIQEDHRPTRSKADVEIRRVRRDRLGWR